MDEHDRTALGEALARLAREAGAAILDARMRGAAVAAKADSSPVTDADLAAEAVILRGLARLSPGLPVVSEERHAAGGRPDPGAVFFLVDPLDGTREFVAGRDEFCVNIALVEAGRPSVGVVFAPAMGRLFASHGLNGASETRVGRGAEESRLLATRPATEAAPVALASRSHDQRAVALAQRIGARVVLCGSAVKFGILAAGEADLYPRAGPTCEWDIAAGEAVLTAAGGSVARFDGGATAYGRRDEDYRNPPFIAASCDAMLARMLDAL